MKIIIAGGTGLIGTQLVNQWLADNILVVVIGRSKIKIQQRFDNRVTAVEWADLQPDTFAEASCVINLAGTGLAKRLWTQKTKARIIASRLESTQKIVSLLLKLGPTAPPLFNASAIGIYGTQRESTLHVDEHTTIDRETQSDFLAQVARLWEQATLSALQSGFRVIHLRFGIVLAKRGGALPILTLPFHFFMGGRLGTGRQPFSWVAIDDVVSAINFLIQNPTVSGPVNIVSPHPITQQELATAISRTLNRPCRLAIPSTLITMSLGEMGKILLLQGQRVSPSRLLAMGFHFRFPTIDMALKHILL